MATVNAAPLDEIQYRRPEIIDWWVREGGQPMDENMIHRYFCESSFFDWESKNGLLLTQARQNVDTWYLTCNRKAFEAQIRQSAGLEFLIVDEPQPVADNELAAQGTTTGVWVIRKQLRELVPRGQIRHAIPPHVLVEPHPRGQWELTVLGTYFVVGDAIYQAPSVFDVIGNRLLSTTACLDKFLAITDGLPRYSPAMGHHYLPSRTSRPISSTSVPGTPRSREASIAPTDEGSIRSNSIQDQAQTNSTTPTTNAKESRLLADSLMTSILYGDEYTDENPLIGEPGNLRFTTSTNAVKKRRADEEAVIAKARAEKEIAVTSRVTSPKPEKPAPTPPAVFSEAKALAKAEKGSKDDRRGSKLEKQKRKKSRANVGGSATSPTTPGSTTSTQPPDSALTGP